MVSPDKSLQSLIHTPESNIYLRCCHLATYPQWYQWIHWSKQIDALKNNESTTELCSVQKQSLSLSLEVHYCTFSGTSMCVFPRVVPSEVQLDNQSNCTLQHTYKIIMYLFDSTEEINILQYIYYKEIRYLTKDCYYYCTFQFYIPVFTKIFRLSICLHQFSIA